MDNSVNSPAISRQVLEMITVAHEYCLFFEQAEKQTSHQIISFFQKIAPLLYLKGTLLPSDIDADAEFSGRYVSEEQWEDIFKTLREKFQDDDVYYALDENADSAEYSLADNMADIYQDMKDFVMLYQKPPTQSKEFAVAELQKLFEMHWGPSLLRALIPTHTILHKNALLPSISEDEWD